MFCDVIASFVWRDDSRIHLSHIIYESARDTTVNLLHINMRLKKKMVFGCKRAKRLDSERAVSTVR